MTQQEMTRFKQRSGTTVASATRIRLVAARVLKNPHFWVVLSLSAFLLFVYQAWPWPEYRLAQGFWSNFRWLSHFEPVLHIELASGFFGILFLIPIVYGSVALSWLGGLFAWLLSLIWLLPELSSWSARREHIILPILLVPVLLASVVSAERRWREIEKRNYREREEQRQAYIARLVEGQEAERRRIAQEIHDETLQTLLVVANKLDALVLRSPADEQTEGIRWAREVLGQSMGDLRRLSMNLRPNILDNFGLVAGIRWLVDNIGESNCHFVTLVKGEAPKMSSLAEVTAFRVTQEAVRNIQRHAMAKNASVTLEFASDHLVLDVQDDGVGFPVKRSSEYAEENRLGIVGMEQRILAMSGTIVLQSSPGRGTRLRATLPYKASDQLV